MFVSTVCVRVRLDPDDGLARLVERVAGQVAGALTHQAYPFGRIVERLPRPGPGLNPVFDAFFAVQDLGVAGFRKGPLELRAELDHPGTTRFDLNMQACVLPEGLFLDLEYATELFAPESARYLMNSYLDVLADLVAEDDRPVYRARPGGAAVEFPDFDFDPGHDASDLLPGAAR
jgi:non-ribosomal peptide synthetase component F